MLFSLSIEGNSSVDREAFLAVTAFREQTWGHHVTPREDVLDRALITLHTVLHQCRVLVDNFKHGEHRQISNIHEPKLTLNLVDRHGKLITLQLELND